jgi:hypothetical protein
MTFRRTPVALVACFVAALMTQAGHAQVGTQITYQGELQQSSTLVNGFYQMRFTAFDSPTGGIQLGSSNLAVATVVDGKFSVLLDFGTALNNAAAHLQIEVRPNGSGAPFEVLTPRQRITPTPSALWAVNAAFATNAITSASAVTATNATQLGGQAPTFYQNAANLTTGTVPDARLGGSVARTNVAQTFTAANTFSNAANAFSGTGAGLTALNATNLTTGTVADARLGSTVARTNVAQSFTAANTFTNTANAFSGSGAGLTALNASNISSGTIANARTTGAFTPTPNTLVLRDGSGGFSVNSLSASSISGDGQALLNLNASNLASGTVSAARLPSTVARTDIANNFGNFASTFLGSVGIGTASPAAPLHVAGSGQAIGMLGASAAGSTQLLFGTSSATNGYATIQGVRAAGSAWGNLILNPTDGRVGVGYPTPDARLHVRAESNIAAIFDGVAASGTWLAINNESSDSTRYWNLISTGSGNFEGAGNLLFAVGNNLGVAEATPMIITRTGRVGIGTVNPGTALHVVGTTRTGVLEITGGSDIAEPYCVAPSEGVHPEPGMVVSIDPDHVGKLRVSSDAYDTTVAGIISGANGVNVGLTLRQEGSKVADGSLPIANVGRVWCWVDADSGAVKPGDLLTTSHTPGHAMKADPSKANGASLGKAMSRLDSGKGMVLVLVGLQ